MTRINETDAQSFAPPHEAPLRGQAVCCLVRTEAPARNARLIKMAEAAAAAGAATTILYESSTLECEEPQGPFAVHRIATAPPNKNPVRAIRVAANIWRETIANPWRIAREATAVRAGIYHVHFLPMLLPGYLAARRTGAALVYDARDLYLDAGYVSVPAWMRWYLGMIEKRLVHAAQAVLAVGNPMAEVLEQRYGLPRVHVVMNGPYECTHDAAPVASPTRLLFQGAFGRNRNLPNLVRAMDSLRGIAELTLQGWGEVEDELRELVDTLGLEGTVRFREPCEPRGVVKCAREYDVGVICYRADSLNLEISTPNKLFDYIGAGLAVAASDLPGLRSVLEPAGCGVMIDPTSAETIAAALREIASDRERVGAMKQAAVVACGSLCWARQAETLVNVYVDAVNARKPARRSNRR